MSTLRLRNPYPPGEDRVGRIMVPVTLGNIVEPARVFVCDALVDTGAYCMTLPASWKGRLGDLPMSRSVVLELADQTPARGELCGPVRIQIAGFDAIAGKVLFLDDEGGARWFEPLVGYITLEQANAAVDMLRHRLFKQPTVDMKRAAAA